MTRPPRLARSILRRFLPGDTRNAVDGDLFQLHRERQATHGTISADLWYWRETLSFAARFAADGARRLLVALFSRDGAPSALDFKLGARMLMKYPGLAIVGGLGIAVATAIGVGTFAFFHVYLQPALPLRDGDRIVNIINWDTKTQNDNRRILHDFVTWRRELTSVVDLGAFRTTRRTLTTTSTGAGESITLAEMSASGFRVAAIPPLLGRPLLDIDEQPGASPALVIGYDVWQTRFDGDRSIIGRTVRLDRVAHTIVGVMPDSFGFPISHSYWVALRVDASAYEFGKGPELSVFGRLAPGKTPDQAKAELTVIARRLAAAHPETHATLQPLVTPFTNVLSGYGGDAWVTMMFQAVVVLLLAIVCTNVAILVYARTVTRSGEIAVRTALGATRMRIVTQLFAEAFVLSVLSALLGLGLVAIGLRYLDHILGFASPTGKAPFWLRPGLSVGTVVYTLALAVLAAVIVGVLPALRATGSQLRSRLSNMSGGTKAQLGRTWTFMVVTQVAITIAALPPALLKGLGLTAQATQQPGFSAEQYLVAQIVATRDGAVLEGEELATPAVAARLRAAQAELQTRLASQPGVVASAFADDTPGDEQDMRVGLDGDKVARVRRVRVGAGYFDTFDVGVVAGRAFNAADALPTATPTVIVNRSFVEEVFGGASAIGRRIRRGVTDTGEAAWYTIVGVVDDFPAGFREPGMTHAKVYFLATPADLQWGFLAVRLRGRAPNTFASTLREIAADVDPGLDLRRIGVLDSMYAERRRAMLMSLLALLLVVGSVLLLSTAGMYALMSFTVNQRRREIGIRSALGADARHILTGILSRAVRQLAIGATLGLVFTVALDRVAGGDLLSGTGLVLVPSIAAFMTIVGIAAAVGPARRGLRVEPTEALRGE